MVSKRIVWLLASIVLMGSLAEAQPYPSTKALQVLKNMFTQNGFFGFPPYAADPFACSAVTERSTYYNTTSKTNLFCNGTAWTVIGAGGTVAGNMELRDPTLLAAESLTNGVLTGGASWTQSADFALAANAATYTHATGAGAFQQTSAAGAIPWGAVGINGWFSFTYTTSAVTGTPVCTVPATFALSAQALTVTAGTYTVVFRAMATTVGAFSVACTSASAATVTFDTLSLKQVNGGTVTAQGRFLSDSSSILLPGFSFVYDPDSGLGGRAGGGVAIITDGLERWVVSPQLTPRITDTYNIGDASLLVKDAYLVRSIQGGKAKSLTDAAAATPFVTAAVATNGWVGGELGWTATSVSGADQLVANGSVRWWGATTSTTPVCGINKIGTDGEGHSGGANTLVCTWTNVVAAQTCALSVTCTNDLAGTQAITLTGRANMPTTATLVFP